MRKVINAITLASTVVVGNYTATLVAGHGMVVGNMLVLKQDTSFFQAIVLNVATNTITIDRPFDYAYTAAATGQRCTYNMAVNGSVTPQVFYTGPADTNIALDINNIVFHLEDNLAMDTSKFGGIPTLTRGVVVRRVDGTTKNLMNVKNNGELANYCTHTVFDLKAPAGEYGFTAIKTFNSQMGNGVAIRLNNATRDELQIIIQDDLSDLISFYVMVQGHVVQGT
jgi:hypothetical protein